jgi:periplasmic glucans biosynthesis protein
MNSLPRNFTLNAFRIVYAVLILTCLSVTPCSQAEEDRPTHAFNRQWLEDYAKELASKPFVEQKIEADNPLSQLNYDDYKKIQFQRAATIWAKEDRQFRLIPMHPGFLFKTPVKLNLVVGGVSRRILYTSEIFNYDKDLEAAKQSKASGYSGFQVTTPINNSDVWDEFMVFQGGSYFRAVGKHNWYGLSARGLAINTARPSGEEFPVFTEFWIERPKERSPTLVIHAMMESKSLTGAFTFKATPGDNTVVEVNSRFYPRRSIESFGIAPLTSMFLFNAMDRQRFDDFRPAVHDSDGLFIISSNGEKIWRPLINPKKLQVSAFSDTAPSGFGLLQRHRQFHDFQDMEANYEKRASAWVEPIGDWGPGHVELIEIPTNAEIHDNIVAFWQPKAPLRKGQEYSFQYKIFWGMQIATEGQSGRIVASASGRSLSDEKVREFVLDYSGPDIPNNLVVNASTSAGNMVGSVVKILPQTGQCRVVVKFAPGDENMAELRVGLTSNNKPWGETWLYRWTR